MGKFSVYKGNGTKGFWITFDNGVTATVQFGSGDYCENYHKWDLFEASETYLESSDAEVAAWIGNKDRGITHLVCKKTTEYDRVGACLSVDEVMDFLNNCRNFKTKEVSDNDNKNSRERR